MRQYRSPYNFKAGLLYGVYRPLAAGGAVRLGHLRVRRHGLVQISTDGSTILWDSLQINGGASDTDPLRGTQGMAYDPLNDVIALASNRTGGVITIFDAVTKTVFTTFNLGSTTNTDLAFDAVGNLYVGNRSAERVRVWSPGGDSIWTSSSDGSFVPAAIPEPTSLALLGLSGLALLRRRR